MIQKSFVDDVLREMGLRAHFDILKDDASISQISIMQPNGEVAGDESGVFATNHDLMIAKVISFLKLNTTKSSSLVVLPEYCVPWEVFDEINSKSLLPKPGQLWIFGCAGITPERLREVELQQRNIRFEYERDVLTDRKFFGSAAYVFQALNEHDQNETVCIIQFKNHAMGDSHQFERENLILGNKYYIFRNLNDEIRLATLICADSLNPQVTERFREIFEQWSMFPYWLIHLQLNKDPRSHAFKKYREDYLGVVRNADKKAILSLNWAQGTNIMGEDVSIKEFGKSALVIKEKEIKIPESVLEKNHNLGAYYTFSQTTRANTVYFNFSEFAFHFKLAKISRNEEPGPTGTINLAALENTYSWNGDWQTVTGIDDLSIELCPWRNWKTKLLQNPPPKKNIEREYILLKSTGYFDCVRESPASFHSIRIDTTEAIKRLTFLQDTVHEAKEFREGVIYRFKKLIEILEHRLMWPALLQSHKIKGCIGIVEGDPFLNLLVDDGNEVIPIFVAFLGSVTADEARESILSLEKKYRGANRKNVFLWREDRGQILNFSLSKKRYDVDDENASNDISGA